MNAYTLDIQALLLQLNEDASCGLAASIERVTQL
jgi:hypothetical protein